MKIYTRTGDKGQTTLFTGERVQKDDAFIEALGTVDEANSAIGLAVAMLPRDHKFDDTRKQLIYVQHALFDVGAAIATPRTKANETKLEKTRFDSSGTKLLEQWIDQMEETLPPLKHFILPGGEATGATLHLARSLCRRAERCLIQPHNKGDLSPDVLVFMNRLSDYLFVVSRFVNHALELPETLWQPHKQFDSSREG